MTADKKFEDGVVSGANELAARIIIAAQWGVPLTPEAIDAMKQVMVEQLPGEIRDILNPHQEGQIEPDPYVEYDMDDPFGDDL